MKRINLLLRLYFQETEQEGFRAPKRILTQADNVDLTTFVGAERFHHAGASEQIPLAQSFNLIEGLLILGETEFATRTELDVRYRPAITSRAWKRLEAPNPSTINSSENSETFQFSLSLIGFEKSASVSGVKDTAVLELLCCSILMENTPEKTIASSLTQFFPNLLATVLWRYADIVPFRQLPVEDEWQIARTDVLLADLAVTAGAQHEYLFRTEKAEPRVTIPSVGVSEGVLTLYKM